MKINMTQWIQDTISLPVKKAMPILSFRECRSRDTQWRRWCATGICRLSA